MEMQVQMPAEPPFWDPGNITVAVAGVALFMVAVFCLIGQYQIVQRDPCAATLRQADPLCESPGIKH